jgi:hypothetical protein
MPKLTGGRQRSANPGWSSAEAGRRLSPLARRPPFLYASSNVAGDHAGCGERRGSDLRGQQQPPGEPKGRRLTMQLVLLPPGPAHLGPTAVRVAESPCVARRHTYPIRRLCSAPARHRRCKAPVHDIVHRPTHGVPTPAPASRGHRAPPGMCALTCRLHSDPGRTGMLAAPMDLGGGPPQPAYRTEESRSSAHAFGCGEPRANGGGSR